MSKKYGFVVTDKGRELIAKLVAGQTLNITRVMVGSGTVDEDVEMTKLTTLVQPVALGTSTIPKYDGASVTMTAEYRSDLNGGLDHGFWLSEFGIYAYDPDVGEIMLYYGSLGDYPQYVSAKSDTGVDVRRFPVCIVIGEDLGVTVDYKCEAWMTAEDVAEYTSDTILPDFLSEADTAVEKHNSDSDAHHAIQTTVADIDARLSLLELQYNTDVTGNPYIVTFASLDGIALEGVWNTAAKRAEF